MILEDFLHKQFKNNNAIFFKESTPAFIQVLNKFKFHCYFIDCFILNRKHFNNYSLSFHLKLYLVDIYLDSEIHTNDNSNISVQLNSYISISSVQLISSITKISALIVNHIFNV